MTEDRESVAAFMIRAGFATGHGDTLDDLLGELEAQVQERASAQERLGETLADALRKAEQFIANGVELGFIRMPDAATPDPAHDTLPAIRTALAQARKG